MFLAVMPTRTSRYRVLLVDDDVDIARVFKLGLEQRGFTVDAYSDPVLASRLVKRGSYDMAVIDLQMPKMDGFELYRLLRVSDAGLPVVFLTAFEMRENDYAKLPPDDKLMGLLKKPLTISQLVAELHLRIDESHGTLF
jgi:two-component system OmpR family response regulator